MSSTLTMTHPAIQAFEPLFASLDDDYEIKLSGKESASYPDDFFSPGRTGLYGYRESTGHEYRGSWHGDMEHMYKADADDLLDFAKGWSPATLTETGLVPLIRELLDMIDHSASDTFETFAERLYWTYYELNDDPEKDGSHYDNAFRNCSKIFNYNVGEHLSEFNAYMRT